jgi:hypothetical protein
MKPAQIKLTRVPFGAISAARLFVNPARRQGLVFDVFRLARSPFLRALPLRHCTRTARVRHRGRPRYRCSRCTLCARRRLINLSAPRSPMACTGAPRLQEAPTHSARRKDGSQRVRLEDPPHVTAHTQTRVNSSGYARASHAHSSVVRTRSLFTFTPARCGVAKCVAVRSVAQPAQFTRIVGGAPASVDSRSTTTSMATGSRTSQAKAKCLASPTRRKWPTLAGVAVCDSTEQTQSARAVIGVVNLLRTRPALQAALPRSGRHRVNRPSRAQRDPTRPSRTHGRVP